MATPITCSGHRAAIYALAKTHEADCFLSAGGDGWVVRWNTHIPDTGYLLATIGTQVFSLCEVIDQQCWVVGDMNGGMHWIDTPPTERTRSTRQHRKSVFDIQYSAPWLLSAGGDGVLTRWDVERRQAVESLQLSEHSLRSLALAKERNEIAVGASDSCIYLLDRSTLEVRSVIRGAHVPSVFTVAYSPDEHYLVSGGRDAMLRVWDLKAPTPQLISEQPAHWYTINHIAWSPCGRWWATASRDRTVKIWDARSFRLLRVLDPIRDGGHTHSVNRLLWLPQLLVSASDDRTLKLWETDTFDLDQ